MKPTYKFPRLDRRAMLSALTLLPVLPMLLPVSATGQIAAGDSLPSWNDTATKKAVVSFVERVTKQGSPDFVPPAERIATFDNEGPNGPIPFRLPSLLIGSRPWLRNIRNGEKWSPINPRWRETSRDSF